MNIYWLLLWLLPTTAAAVCPLCTLAVGAGVGLSRWLAIDDLISGLWIGALLLSVSLWIVKRLRSKHITSNWVVPDVIVLVYLLAIIPLYWTGTIGNPLNQWHGFDRLIVGIGLGTVVFISGIIIHACIKVWRGHVLVPFQKIVIPITMLTLVSIIIYSMGR